MLRERLKLLRMEKRLTQKELANLLDLSNSTIGMYETGRRSPDAETLNRLADILDVSVDYLLGRTLQKRYDMDENQWIDVSDLSPDDVKLIKAMIERLKG